LLKPLNTVQLKGYPHLNSEQPIEIFGISKSDGKYYYLLNESALIVDISVSFEYSDIAEVYDILGHTESQTPSDYVILTPFCVDSLYELFCDYNTPEKLNTHIKDLTPYILGSTFNNLEGGGLCILSTYIKSEEHQLILEELSHYCNIHVIDDKQ